MEIDNTIIAGVMTSIATIIAAYITVSSVKKANKNLEKTDKYSIFNKTYTILERISDNNIVAIKDGFSWSAFFFHIFWLFYSKLWEFIFTAILILGGLFVHFYIVDYIGNTNLLYYYEKILKFVISYSPIFLGIFGNKLLVRNMQKVFVC